MSEQTFRSPSIDLSSRRAFRWSIALALLFLVATAFQSVATLMFRLRGDVMRTATGGLWSGAIGREAAFFVLALVILHLAFGLAIYLLARVSAAAWPILRHRLELLVLGWFVALASAVIAYNVVWFPRTGLGAYYHGLATLELGPMAIGKWLYLGVLVLSAFALLAAARRHLLDTNRPTRLRPPAVGVAVLLLVVALTLGIAHRARTAIGDVNERPNIIILGIDSLRLNELQRFGGTGDTPNLDRFLASADIVRDVTTPVARTFPSWAAILSGRSPIDTGVRFNLAPRDILRVNPTIGDVLRDSGYRTIYSTDEVRFANIDESYGFDQVVTPPIGAADFVIGSYNELPLVSVVANTRLGHWLFPYSHGNRGAASLFQPATYLDRLERELSFDDGPTFLITHLTASHWPYYVSDTPFGVTEKTHPEDRPLYRLGVRIADTMFGDLVALLERKGALRNAIVVVLSDHGEALALPSDTMIADGEIIEGLRAPLVVLDNGHGQSVLSPVQYQVLLGFRTFGSETGIDTTGRDIPGGATVEDIAPTLLDLAGVSAAPLRATGLSFANVLRDASKPQRVAESGRVRYTETDLKVLPSTDGGVDEIATAQQNSKFFEVIPSTGRMSVRKSFMPLSLAFKERAAFTELLLLAALPAGPDAHQYVLVDKTTGKARLLLERPGEDASAARDLWDAMWAHYAGELRTPVSVTREDWPAIEEGWRSFFTRRTPSADAAADTASTAAVVEATNVPPTT